jgi:hypothetical protein
VCRGEKERGSNGKLLASGNHDCRSRSRLFSYKRYVETHRIQTGLHTGKVLHFAWTKRKTHHQRHKIENRQHVGCESVDGTLTANSTAPSHPAHRSIRLPSKNIAANGGRPLGHHLSTRRLGHHRPRKNPHAHSPKSKTMIQ